MDEVLNESNQTYGEAPVDNSLNANGEDLATGAEHHATYPLLGEHRLKSKHQAQQPKKAISADAPSVPKLRPALDVLNRLRYDPDLDDEDHVVGYRDRHDGVQELCASLWKSDTTDEEFIPQHRIKYFKRKSDDVVVWDRFMRLDLIFGSGLKQVCPYISRLP